MLHTFDGRRSMAQTIRARVSVPQGLPWPQNSQSEVEVIMLSSSYLSSCVVSSGVHHKNKQYAHSFSFPISICRSRRPKVWTGFITFHGQSHSRENRLSITICNVSLVLGLFQSRFCTHIAPPQPSDQIAQATALHSSHRAESQTTTER
jgi:hypothetical protein